MKQVSQTHHLLKRGTVWYYRRRVPLNLVASVGAKFVQCSLGTSDLAEAKKQRTLKDLHWDAQFDALEHAASAGSATDNVPDKPVLSPVQLVRHYVERMDQRSAARLAEDGPADPAEQREMEMDNGLTLQALTTPGDRDGEECVARAAERLLKESEGTVADALAAQFAEVVRRGLVELTRRKSARLDSDFSGRHFDALFDPARPPEVTFGALADQHLVMRREEAEANGHSSKSIEKVEGFVAVVREIVGENTMVHAVDFDACLRTFGSTSIDPQTGEPVRFTVNAPGTSPHMAIMGKTRSGKSRTGLDAASELVKSANLPLILIDPKGEFVNGGRLVAKPEWQGETLDRYFPGIQPLDVPETRVPLDFLFRQQGASDADLAKLAASFRDSFQKCLRAKGDVALNLLRETVVELLRTGSGPVSLRNVREGYAEAAEHAGKSGGGISAKLSEIEALGLFAPTMAPADFFGRRWVVSFGGCSEEPKRLSIFLLLDALNSYMLSLADSGMDAEGHRSLRHLLVVDEAREILSYKHGALSSLIRKSASKGGVTMLLSQGPDDFDQEEDDFLEQMGTVGVFALSAASVKSLTGTFGKRMKVEDFAEKALPAGTALVKMPGQPTRKVIAWK